MVLGIGIDVIETARMERALARHGGTFEARVFTEAECADCAKRADRSQAFAARFAAKEALMRRSARDGAEESLSSRSRSSASPRAA